MKPQTTKKKRVEVATTTPITEALDLLSSCGYEIRLNETKLVRTGNRSWTWAKL